MTESSNVPTFEMLYHQYKFDVLNRTLTLLHNHHDAEDAAQETWKTVSENIHLFRTGDPRFCKATIIRIAKCKAIDLFRKRARNDAMTEDAEAAAYSADEFEDSVFHALCEREDASRITACLREMDERYTDVLRLYYVGGHTAKEIGRLLSIPQKTVETRLKRGKNILAQKLKKRGTEL